MSMDTVEIALLIIVCILLGSISVGLAWLKTIMASWRTTLRDIENRTQNYEAHLKRQVESNNAMVAKVVEMGDKLASHDMMLKGVGKR